MQASLQTAISAQLGSTLLLQVRAVGGGSINQTYRLQNTDGRWFCKINSAGAFPQLFEKEAAGLAFLNAQNILRTPKVLACFEHADQQVLLLEWIEEGQRTKQFWQRFGEQLAALHRVSHNQFGFAYDNYMGSVPQQNSGQQNWVDFFIQYRLAPMVKRCAEKLQLSAKHLSAFEQLYQRLPSIFNDEPASLLHGDLWSGNFMCSNTGQPVLIDPAVYYGHRSVDLALTTLFGGFDQSFYDAYRYHYPLPTTYQEQFAVANLYPLLIHLYLFGSSYLSQIERTLFRFV